MTDGERALQFWSVLALAARNQNLVSYKQLRQITGMAAAGVGRPLGHINAYCHYHKLPPLNLIAVSQTNGKPEAHFLQGTELVTGQARVFVYDWFAVAAPTAEALSQAFETAKRNGLFDADVVEREKDEGELGQSVGARS